MGVERTLDEGPSCGVRHHFSILGGEGFIEVTRKAHQVRVIGDRLRPALDQCFCCIQRSVVGKVTRSQGPFPEGGVFGLAQQGPSERVGGYKVREVVRI